MIMAVSPRTDGWVDVFIAIASIFAALKCGDILRDLFWLPRHGLTYSLAAMQSVRVNLWPDAEELDSRFNRPGRAWTLIEKVDALWPMAIAFRIPIVVSALSGTLLLARPGNGAWVVGIGIVVLVGLLALATVVTLAQGIYLGPYAPYRSEFQLTRRRHRQAGPLDRPVLARHLVILSGYIYLVMFAFGAVFKALHVVAPSTFEITAPAGPSLETFLFFSGATFATLGYGGVEPVTTLARTLVMIQIMLGPLMLSLLLMAWSQPGISAQAAPEVR